MEWEIVLHSHDLTQEENSLEKSLEKSLGKYDSFAKIVASDSNSEHSKEKGPIPEKVEKKK